MNFYADFQKNSVNQYKCKWKMSTAYIIKWNSKL